MYRDVNYGWGQGMDKYLDGTWQEFEALIKDTIGSSFRWHVRPQDTSSNREMIVSLILEDINRNNGVFPEKNAFIYIDDINFCA